MERIKKYIILSNYILIGGILIAFIYYKDFILNKEVDTQNINNLDINKKDIKEYSYLNVYNTSNEEIEIEIKNLEKEEYSIATLLPAETTALIVESGKILLKVTKQKSNLTYNSTKYYAANQSYVWYID